MAREVGNVTFSADASDTELGKIQCSDYEQDSVTFTVDVFGDLGSGTLTFKQSIDGGTTKYKLTYGNPNDHTQISVTESCAFNITMKNPSNKPRVIYGTLANSTNPDFTVVISQ